MTNFGNKHQTDFTSHLRKRFHRIENNPYIDKEITKKSRFSGDHIESEAE